MKIRDITIEGFGVWTGLELLELDDHINVLYGPNEAGKTTLMQFVRAMLYGFSPERRQRYLPPVHGGRIGGRVTLAGADGLFRVERHAADAACAEQLEITAGEERLRDDRLLGRLLGNVDEAVYRNVFAIGLREIQELGAQRYRCFAMALQADDRRGSGFARRRVGRIDQGTWTTAFEQCAGDDSATANGTR